MSEPRDSGHGAAGQVGLPHPMRAVLLVAKRELVTRVRSKAFRITTAIAAVLLVAAAVGGTLLSDDDDVTASIGLVDLPQDNALAVVEAAGTAVDVTLEPEEVGDEAAGRRMVEDGDLDVLLVGGRDGGFTAYSDDELGTEIENAVNVAAVRLALDAVVSDLGGTPQQVDEALAGARVETVSLQTDEYDPERLAIGAIAGLLIYLALLMYGQVVAQGVVEEKSSRIVELLLATIKPWQLMAGKVLGIGLLGIGQLALLGGIGFAAGTITGAITISASALGSIFVWLVIWFLLGYAMYALVFAACGALVSRQEDIGAVVTPITMVVVIGYVVGISVLPSDPANGFARILSMTPVFAPTLMPMRLSIGGVPLWEPLLAVLGTLVVIPALVWLSGRIYRNAVLRTGMRVKLGDALRGD